MEDKDMFCVSCGEAIVINLDLMGEVLECPSCHTRLLLDEADENDSSENDIEWSPEVDGADASRVFGVTSQPAPTATLPMDQLVPTEEIQPQQAGLPAQARGRFPILGFSAFAATAVLGWLFYQETRQTALMAVRMEHLEQKFATLADDQTGSNEALARIPDLEVYLDELDETLSRVAERVRLHDASSLQTDYTLQSAQKNQIRQETEFGKFSVKLALVEQAVADKSRLAKEEFELSLRKRKEAEIAAKPIRQRIRDLEERKNALFAQYRAGSIGKYPHGVVSRGRAAKIMQDYERKAAPALLQIQEEISKIRESIESEEARIEELFNGS